MRLNIFKITIFITNQNSFKLIEKTSKDLSQFYLNLEKEFGANDYHPLPVVLEKGEGVFMWDVNGKKYYDFLSAYSAVNQGHCHPELVSLIKNQAETLTLTSRAFHNNKLGEYMEFATKLFGFDQLLPMNTGAEGVETSIKLSRKWGYLKKKVDENQAKIVVCNNNFHGRTTTVISFSTDPRSKDFFGPHTPGFIHIPHGEISALENEFKKDKNIVAFLVEPIQGEAGVNVPEPEYLKKVRSLCSEYNVLMIADEIQTGLGRTGSLLASCGNCSCESSCEQQSTYVRPDILILAKALSGGTYPISAVLCDSQIMEVIQPGQHGSTFGGNPFAASIAKKALEIIIDEKLAQNARVLGEIFRSEMNKYIKSSKIVKLVRGKGLLNAIVINDSQDSQTAWNICLKLRDNGLLAKPTQGNVIRFAPPLVMTEDQLYDCVNIIISTIKEFE